MSAKACSFDIVSVTNLAEVKNAVNQATMEITQRFDFKNSKSRITLEEKDNQIILIADDEQKLRSVIDILQGKLVKRKVSLKSLDYGKVEPAAENTVRQTVKLLQGVSQDKSREIMKSIKEMGIKVQSQYMDEQVRVSGKSRDDLQAVIARLRAHDFGIPLEFTNYR